jgi:hypothetical protein
VQGLQSDLDPSGEVFWERLEGRQPIPFQTSVYQALEDEAAEEVPTAKLVARMRERVRSGG